MFRRDVADSSILNLGCFERCRIALKTKAWNRKKSDEVPDKVADALLNDMNDKASILEIGRTSYHVLLISSP